MHLGGVLVGKADTKKLKINITYKEIVKCEYMLSKTKLTKNVRKINCCHTYNIYVIMLTIPTRWTPSFFRPFFRPLTSTASQITIQLECMVGKKKLKRLVGSHALQFQVDLNKSKIQKKSWKINLSGIF